MRRSRLSGVFSPAPRPELLPAVVASAVATAATLAALASSLESTPYKPCVLFFLCVGYLSQAAPLLSAGSFGRSFRGAGLALSVVLIPVLSLWVSPSALLPDEALNYPDLRTAILTGWLLVGLTFVVRPAGFERRRGLPLSFLAVPSLTVFGLLATINQNPEVVVAFLLFLAGSLFVISYEQLLERRLIAASPEGGQRSVVRDSVLAVGVLFTLVFAFGCLGTVALVGTSPDSAVQSAVARLQGTSRQYFYQRYGSWASQLSYVRVGGGPSPDSETPLLAVETTEPGLLRGRSYAIYDGRGWRDGADRLGGRRIVRRSADGWYHVSPAPQRGGHTVRHTVRALVDMPSVLFSGGLPLRIWNPSSSSIRVDAQGCVHAQRVVLAEESYTVESFVSEPPPAAAPVPAVIPQVPAQYLEVPNSATAVFSLAREITAASATPSAKATAITHWLAANCQYDLAAPRTPAAVDVTDYFLTRTKRGACDQWASAGALLCRAAGIPTRFVTGFLLTEHDPELEAYLARECDAHAWFEAYLPPAGWVALDPTVGSAEASPTGGLLAFLNGVQFYSSAKRWAQRHGFWATFATLALYLLWLIVDGLRADRRRTAGGDALTPPQRAVVRSYVAAATVLGRAGVGRVPGQTPLELQRELEQTHPQSHELCAALSRLTEHFGLIRYAGRQPTSEMLLECRSLLRTIRRHAKEIRSRRRAMRPTSAPQA